MNNASWIKLLVCWLAAFVICIPAAAWAEGDGITTAGDSGNTAVILCYLEMFTGVGAIVWEIRRKMDGSTKCPQYANAKTYYFYTSQACGHYTWPKVGYQEKLARVFPTLFQKLVPAWIATGRMKNA